MQKSILKSIFILVILVAVSALVYSFQQNGQTVTANAVKTAETGGNIKFMSWEEAQSSVAANPKKIFVDIYTPWCGPCKIYGQRMQDPVIANYLGEKYYSVKFNGESGDSVKMGDRVFRNPQFVPGAFRNSTHELTQALGIEAYPTTLIFDENLVLIQKIPGAQDKLTLDQILHFFGDDKYKTQKWEEFQAEYKSPFAVSGQ